MNNSPSVNKTTSSVDFENGEGNKPTNRETYEEAVKRIKEENDELIKNQWVGILALVFVTILFISMVYRGTCI